MKLLTSGKLFTFKGLTYQVKKVQENCLSVCEFCKEGALPKLFDTNVCDYCSKHVDFDCCLSRIYRKDENEMGYYIKNAVDSIKRIETNEVIERLKRFGSFISSGKNSEYLHIFKKPIPVTIQNYPFNGYTKVRAVVYRPAFKGGPIYTVGLYAKHDEKELIGEIIITTLVGKFCPGDTIRIALAIK